ncbi:LDCC motif putative metal-binding protein [Dethiobacter alkaliphilus]|uniref:Uncharacterized protein n=1 Tax=Dethiobacter alkaliphilus AHT 1 TaxID=555088 RepID=C0GJS1_DETAL|nr:LDCC motif putative metal-binding protein [Dethiobacter alkaliphilus]EEG76379.1 hypothetical protein DealDRAFT_2724 [Dethiobacter alkaliphilus AHT 1]
MFAAFRRFLERLAKSNEKEFKGDAPDCCTVNQPDAKPKVNEDNNKQK